MVSDEDLEYVKEQLGIGASEYVKVDAVVSELIALRQVAREACKLVDPYADDPSWERTRDALKAAGW